MWTKPTLTRKITFNQFNLILLYTALGHIEVMKKLYQYSIKLIVLILHNLMLNIILEKKIFIALHSNFLLAINFGERKTLATWRMLGVDGWVVGGCAFPGTQIPRTFSPTSVFRPSH